MFVNFEVPRLKFVRLFQVLSIFRAIGQADNRRSSKRMGKVFSPN